MANITEWTAAGFDSAHVAYRNSSGFFVGYANLTAANADTVSGMRKLRGAFAAPYAIPEPNRVGVLGDNTRLSTFEFASSDETAFIYESGVADLVFEGAAQGSAVKTEGEWDFGIRGASTFTRGNFIWLLTRDAQNQESGSGSPGFENLLLMNTLVTPIGDDTFSHQAEGGSRYSVTINRASTNPRTGDTIALDFTLSDATSLHWFSQYRTMLDCWIADGVEDDFEASYVPISTAKSKAWNLTTNTALTVSTVNTTTRNVALSAAPADDSFICLTYEYSSIP